MMLSSLPTRDFPPLYSITNSEIASGVSVMLGDPESSGSMKLKSKNITASLEINLNFLTSNNDMKKMKDGIGLAWELSNKPEMKKLTKRFIMWNAVMMGSDKHIENMIRTTVRGSLHPVGTLKMGLFSDPLSVTDQFGMVHGTDNITVADASLMPFITDTPTNISCLVIGEKISNALLDKCKVH
jgi:choline dehydrogenase